MKTTSIKEKAVDLRKLGYSYSMIAAKLGLSKSTLNHWLKEIPYRPNKEVLKRINSGLARSIQTNQNRKIENIVRIKNLARKELKKITKRDLWLLGIGLYLGEGMKLQESVRIINSDPEIIKLAIKWFREICGLGKENFTIAIHTYPDNNIKENLNFWIEKTGIPKNQFGKTQIDLRKNKSGKKKRKLPYGTAHLTIKAMGKKEFGNELHRRIMGWIEVVLNYAGVVQR